MSRIADLMAANPVVVRGDESVAAAVRKMADHDVGAVLVVDGEALVGMFSERDVVVRVVAAAKDPATTPVGDVATREFVAVAPDDRIRTALERLGEGRFRHLPVVDGKRPIGILSTRDLMAAAIGRLESYIEQRAFENESAAGDDPYDHFGGGYGK